MSYSPDIKGLKELKDELSGQRVKKEIAIEIGRIAISFHKALSYEVFQKYQISPNTLDKYWENKHLAAREVGKSVIQQTLKYRYAAKDLSKFDFFWYVGNIKPNPKRPGRVHEVIIKRNSSKIVHGKYGYGGFVPIGFRNEYGTQMFERTGPSRDAPLHVLFGPSVSEMAESVFNDEPSSIKDILESFEISIEKILRNL